MEKDSLHNLFNKKFNDPSKGEMNWVNPDDSIFENALSELSKENRKKPVFWRNRYGLLVLLMIPFAGLLAYYTTIISKTQSISHVAMQSNTLLNANIEATKVKEEKTFTSGEITTNATQSEIASVPQEINVRSVSTFAFPPNTPTNSTVTSSNDSQLQQTINSIDAAQLPISIVAQATNQGDNNLSKTIQSLESKETVVEVESIQNIDPLGQLDKRIVISEFPIQLSAINTPEIVELNAIKLTNATGRSFSFSAGYLYSAVSHPNGILSNDMVINGHDQYQSGWNLEAAYNRGIGSNWTLNTSMGFNRIQMNSLTTCSLQYDSDYEHMSQGQLMYKTPLTLITPTTGFVDNVEFAIEQGAMSDDEMYTNNMNISQGISTLSLAIGLSNEIFSTNQFSLGIGVNVGLDYIVQIQERMKVELMAEDYMLFEKDKEWINHHGLNRLGASTSVNISGQWKISEKHSLFVRPSYRRSLTSVRSADILTERSYFNIFNVSTGVNISF